MIVAIIVTVVVYVLIGWGLLHLMDYERIDLKYNWNIREKAFVVFAFLYLFPLLFCQKFLRFMCAME